MDFLINNLKTSFFSLNVLLIAVSYLISSKISIFFMIIFLALTILHFFKIFEKIEKSQKFRNLQLKNTLYQITKNAQSFTQKGLLVSKFLSGIKIEKNEDEITSFTEFKDHFGSKWPFMMQVSNTGKEVMNVLGKPARCFSSYSYLNLNRDPRVQEAAIASARLYSSGNVGPRMLCGNLEILEELEVQIAQFLQKESALVFSAGFLACMSAICGIARKDDLLLMDKLCHNSLRTGAKLSGSTIVTFSHNNFNLRKMTKLLHNRNKFDYPQISPTYRLKSLSPN